MKFYRCSVNLKKLKYYLDHEPNKLIFEAYDRQELILLCYAMLEEYKKNFFLKKLLTLPIIKVMMFL